MVGMMINGVRYCHMADGEKDYLLDQSDSKVKVNLIFTKDKEKNEAAKEGLKTFFSRL